MIARPYFHAKLKAGKFDVSGQHSCVAGTPIYIDQESLPDGVFAEWSWDGQQLTVRNDRYGFYPLFCYQGDNEICVSPSLAHIVSLCAPRDLDDAALSVFLRLGYFIGEDTPFKHVRALPPSASFRWSGTKVAIVGKRPLRQSEQSVSRDEAIDRYIVLFRESIQRRLPRDESFAVPLSGGRDSRHILFELCNQGCFPKACITSGDKPNSGQDLKIAPMVAKEIGVPHVVVQQTESWFRAEQRKNEVLGLMSDEADWCVAMADYCAGRINAFYDGMAGDVLSAAHFYSATLEPLFVSGRLDELTNTLLDNSLAQEGFNERTLCTLLTPEALNRFDRGVAFDHLQTELRQHLSASDPADSYYFWNRTRREIALVTYGIFAAIPNIFLPFLDRDVYDFLTSLPFSMLKNKSFHTDAILRAFPKYAHVPFESKGEAHVIEANAAARNSIGQQAKFARDLAKYAVLKRPSRIMRNTFLQPRLLRCLLSSRYSASTTWFSRLALYLHQLETMAYAG